MSERIIPRRATIQIRADLLKALSERPPMRTCCMQRTNITWNAFKKVEEDLAERGLIVAEEGRRRLLRITPAGMDTLDPWPQVERVLT